MAVAFEPRHPQNDQWSEYVQQHPERPSGTFEEAYLQRTRVLVVSLLHGKDYYTKIAEEIFRKRFHKDGDEVSVEEHVSVLDLYPGYIDPETLVARVRRQMRSAHLEGRPFSAVILDNVHNLLLQFPLLEKEPLLWPTLFRQFRSEGVDTITTFTFFKVALIDRTEEPMLAGSEHIFFQLLVSNCDYTFFVERPAAPPPRVGRNWIQVRLASTIDGFGKEPTEFWWDPTELTYCQPP